MLLLHLILALPNCSALHFKKHYIPIILSYQKDICSTSIYSYQRIHIEFPLSAGLEEVEYSETKNNHSLSFWECSTITPTIPIIKTPDSSLRFCLACYSWMSDICLCSSLVFIISVVLLEKKLSRRHSAMELRGWKLFSVEMAVAADH